MLLPCVQEALQSAEAGKVRALGDLSAANSRLAELQEAHAALSVMVTHPCSVLCMMSCQVAAEGHHKLLSLGSEIGCQKTGQATMAILEFDAFNLPWCTDLSGSLS